MTRDEADLNKILKRLYLQLMNLSHMDPSTQIGSPGQSSKYIRHWQVLNMVDRGKYYLVSKCVKEINVISHSVPITNPLEYIYFEYVHEMA